MTLLGKRCDYDNGTNKQIDRLSERILRRHWQCHLAAEWGSYYTNNMSIVIEMSRQKREERRERERAELSLVG